MYKFATILLAAIATITPTVSAQAGGYGCKERNWQGGCRKFGTGCTELQGEWGRTLSSFGPDNGYGCTLYSGPNCRAFSSQAYRDINHPGKADLREIGYDNVPLSVSCYKLRG